MATLELNIDPTGAEAGARRTERALDGIKRGARSTERATDELSNSFTELRARMNPAFRASLEFGRGQAIVNRALKEGVISAKQHKVAMAELEVQYRKTSGAATGLAAKLKGIGTSVAVAGTLITAAIGRSVTAFRDFDRSIAEVTTLISGTAEETEFLERSTKDLAAQFGTSATQQAQAFYQAISSGVGDVVQANQFLIQANKLAVGGVTEITNAVDILTTVTRAYEAQGLTAARASDILFAGVRVGRTNIAALSSSLAKVIPIAEKTGVSLEELVASIAAFTGSSGASTAEAVTGIRAAIGSLLKPSEEAKKLARDLGIEFNAEALAAKGLSGVLDEVAEKTGGNVTQITRLFGSIEAMPVVLNLMSNGGVNLANAMDAVTSSVGAAEEAFVKVDQTLSQRFLKQLGILGNLMLDVGKAALTVIVPALEAITANSGRAAVALALIGGAAAVTFAPVIGTLTVLGAAIFAVSENWELLKGIATAALDEITSAVGIATEASTGTLSTFFEFAGKAWSLYVETTKRAINAFIGIVTGGLDIANTAWSNFFGLAESAAVGAVNFAVQGVQGLVNVGINAINNMIDGLNKLVSFFGGDRAAQIFGFSGQLGRLDNVDFSGLTVKASQAGQDAGKALAESMARASNALVEDHLRNLTLSLGDFAQRVTQRAQVNGTLPTTSPAAITTAANDNGLPTVTRPRVLENETKKGNTFLDEIAGNTNAQIDALRGLDTGLSSEDQRFYEGLFEQQGRLAGETQSLLQRFLSGIPSTDGANQNTTQTFSIRNGTSPITQSLLRRGDEIQTARTSLETQRQTVQNQITILEGQPTSTAGEFEIKRLEQTLKEIDASIADMDNRLISINQEINRFDPAPTPIQPNVQFLGSFNTGGFGRVGGSGGPDSITAVANLSPGELYAFNENGVREAAREIGATETKVVQQTTNNINFPIQRGSERAVLTNRRAVARNLGLATASIR